MYISYVNSTTKLSDVDPDTSGIKLETQETKIAEIWKKVLKETKRTYH